MKLCGEGFQIASAKDDDGHWDWRTFGTGEGFSADAIITGYLSADRIEANTITANKLAADVGQSLDLSSNVSINMVVESMVDSVAQSILDGVDTPVVSPFAPEPPKQDQLWLDTMTDAWKRWDGTAWVECSVSDDVLANIYANIEKNRTAIEQSESSIRMTVEQQKTEFDSSLTGLESALQSFITQTAKDITFVYNEATNYTVSATGEILEYINQIQSYQRFDANGLELGVLGSPFLARLGNSKLSFLQDGTEIAYISNNRLYITSARITEKLTIGADDNGCFEW